MTLYAQINVALPRDPRMIAAGPMARLLYVQAVLYCRENLTDGIIDRLTLPFIGPDIPNHTKHMARLVEVGLLAEHPDGWAFPAKVWATWNPSKADVEAKRAADAQRKAEWRDRKRDAVVTVGQEGDSVTARRGRDRQPEPEPEPEPEPSSPLPPTHAKQGTQRPAGGEGRIEKIITAYGTIAADKRRATNPASYARTTTRTLRTNIEQMAELHRLADMFPDAKPHTIAAALHGEKSALTYERRADEDT